MPSNWLFVDTQFPSFTGEESAEEKIGTLQNYMFMLVEQLRYSLHHLDSSNVTSIDMDKTKIYSGKTTLQTIIKDNDKISSIEQSLEGIRAAVYGKDGQTDIEIGEGGIAAQVKNLQTGMSTVVQLVDGGLYVIDEEDKYTRITGDHIYTTFADISGRLKSNKIDLYSDLTVYEDSECDTIGGRIGYTTSSLDGSPGIHIESVDAEGKVGAEAGFRGEFVATANGVKMMYGDNSGVQSEVYLAYNNGSTIFAVEHGGEIVFSIDSIEGVYIPKLNLENVKVTAVFA